MLADILYALRSLRKSPGFTLAAVATLALGIGANTTVFSLINAVQFGIPRFRDPETLVDVHETSLTRLCAGCGVGTSDPGYRDWQTRAHSFAAMAAYGEEGFVLSGRGDPERVSGAFVGASLFPILGVSPALGRNFQSEDDRAGAERVAIVSHTLWQSWFAGTASIVGTSVRINGDPVTIIGVMPANFVFPEYADLWVPFETHAHDKSRSTRDFGVVARLKPGVTIAEADAEMKVIARSLEQEYPQDQSEWSAQVVSLRQDMASDTGNYFWVLLGAVGLVLMATCASLAGLLLARAAGQRKEMALRAALGASRPRLIRQLLTESVVIGILGGIGGLLIAVWGIDLAAAGFTREAPKWIQFGVDGRVLAFCFGVSILTGLIFGAAPALRASRPDLNESLKEGSQNTTAGRQRQRLRAGLVVVEFALALVLLNGAGLMIKTFLRLNQPPAGYDSHNLLLAKLEFLGGRYDDSVQVLLATDRILARLNATAAVRAGASNTQFIAGFGASDQKITVEGLSQIPDGASPRFSFAISPDYFKTLGLPLRQGRDFSAQDGPGSPPVAIVNQAMAGKLWPGVSPLGRRIKLGGASSSRPWVTVIGVVADVDGDPRAGESVANYAYVPLAQSPGRPVDLVLRTPGDPISLASTVRSAVKEVDPDEPVEQIRTAESDLDQRFVQIRLFAVFLISFAVFAVLLAAIGIYGIIAQTVSQRTQEIGIRVALGAERSEVLVLIIRNGAKLASLGLLFGVVGALSFTRVMESVLFGAKAVDFKVLIPVVILLFGVALLASWLPARRALEIDPIQALRAE